jgi:hypothetical protein
MGIGLATVFVLLAGAPVDAPVDVPVAVLRMDALPASCPNEAFFRADVAARLGREPFVADAAAQIHIGVVVDGERLVLAVDALSGAVNLGSRHIEGSLAECAELLSRAALTTSVLLDPLTTVFVAVNDTPTHVLSPAPTPAPAEATNVDIVDVEDAVVPPRPALRSSLYGGLFMAAGQQPGLGIGGRVGVLAELPVDVPLVDALVLGVELHGTAPAAAQVRGGEVVGAGVALALLPCARVWFVDVCGVLDGGAFFGSSRALNSPEQGVLPSAAAGGRVQLRLPLTTSLGLLASGELLVPITRHRLLALDSAVLWETAPVAGTVGSSLVWELP